MKDGVFRVAVEGDIQQFSPEMIREIQVASSVGLSSDVILYAMELGIDLIFTRRNGKPQGRIWNNKFGSVASIRKQQLQFAGNITGAKWVIEKVKVKIDNQFTVLEMLSALTGINLKPAIGKRLKSASGKLDSLKNDSVALKDLYAFVRGIEGSAGKAYFTGLSKLLPEQFQFEKRSSRPAQDMFNALLNYAYGILYGKVETALIKAGLDPMIGVMHRDEYNKPVFTYDFIEPYRAWADITVANLCVQQAIYPDFFDIQKGGYWLNEYGKRILISAFYDYLDEVVDRNKKRFSRKEHLLADARTLAKTLTKKTK